MRLYYEGCKTGVLSFVYTLFIPVKIKTAENQMIVSRFVYPDPVQGIEIIGK